ncbi:MAG: Gfo/Idh/MocA family protein [Thermoguttaceae bacterium]
MRVRLSRRKLLKDSAIVAGVAVGAQVLGVPALLAQRSPNSKLGMALIGANSRGEAHYEACASQRLVALVDIDDHNRYGAVKWLEDRKLPKAQEFTDFRKMYETMAKQVDAVFIAIPDHCHAAAALMGVRMGKHVYCEKPLTHDIYEARTLGEAARQNKVMTQMGNQGHASDGIRLVREFLEAGVIGTVTETHSWQTQVYGPRTIWPNSPAPEWVHWNEWLGPTPYTPYRVGLHPAGGWYQMKTYGTGLLLCVGAHTNDSPHWALQLKYPSSVECLAQAGQTEDVWGTMNTLLFEYPRPNLPPVKAYWYDGVTKNTDPTLKDETGAMLAWVLNRPELAGKMEREYKEKFPAEGGTLFVGEKGILFCGTYGEDARLLPTSKYKDLPRPPQKYPRIPGAPGMFGSQADFMRACTQGGEPPCSNFPDVSGPYIEALLVGNLAMRAGPGKKVQWDGVAMKCTNMPELNQFVKPAYRPGWGL